MFFRVVDKRKDLGKNPAEEKRESKGLEVND